MHEEAAVPSESVAQTPAPAPSEPASPLTPSHASNFDAARRDLMARWTADADDDEEVGDAPSEPAATAAGGAAATEPDDDTDPETPDLAVAQAPQATPPAPTPEGGAAKTEGATEKREQPYDARLGEETWTAPEGLVVRYKADGEERERNFDELVRLAQQGENYDRRSRELAETRRSQEQQYHQAVQTLTERYTQAQQQLVEFVRRMAEDEEFREDYLEQYETLKADPEQLQLRAKAQEADALRAEKAQREQAEMVQRSQRIWTAIDQLIAEGVGSESAPGPYRFADADRVRQRWYALYQQQGEGVVSDRVVRQILAEEHSRVAGAVEAREAALRAHYERQLAEARAQATSQVKNEMTDKALQREREVRRVPDSGVHTPPAPKKAQIRTFNDGSKALARWAES